MIPDVLIVGAGPAGVSAALWSRVLGLSGQVIESGSDAGGQLHHVHFHPADIAGIGTGDGPAIAAIMGTQLAGAGCDVRFDTAAVALEPASDTTLPAVQDVRGVRVGAQAVLVATGVRRRRLDVPGEDAFEGRGVSYSATRDRAQFAGLPVVVAGGGDAAYENALLLTEVGCAVTLAVRGASRARPEFRDRVEADPRITLRLGARVRAVLGDDRVRAVELESDAGCETVPAAAIVIKVGVIPNTEWCRAALDHDGEGFLSVDERGLTSARGVWAAGDATRPLRPSVSVALGSAAIAMADVRRALRG